MIIEKFKYFILSKINASNSFVLNGIPVILSCTTKREKNRGNQYANPKKEPETYEWIDRFFSGNEVFFDIGSNTGGYSLYCVMKHLRMKAFCFDPDVQNIASLNKNIYLNNLNAKLTSVCAAISNKNKLSCFNMFNKRGLYEAGFAGNSVDSINNRSGSQNPVITLGAISLSMDSIVKDFGFPFPDHIKIDVDGHEMSVIDGAREVLSDERLKSIMIEGRYSDNVLIKQIENHGFKRFTNFKNPIYYEMEKDEHVPADMGNMLFIRD
ncbi:FkbM family methyltransferase [uncultured Desulfosarcina sp.]|uniref:FkbM family methyltransferase n=1 Tax=uncultured Desulfosarcina sp. TaxID=218289 RepID=UPI0029C8E248|nr:FkbM family methyltransferase [uncultured Desulfosarcina sp.]